MSMKRITTRPQYWTLLVSLLLSWPLLAQESDSLSGEAQRMAERLAVTAPDQAFVNVTVQFDLNSARIRQESYGVLNDLAQALNSSGLRGYKFVVEGHTDMSGGYATNLELSGDRAQSVGRYLVERGVQGNSLDTVGKSYGELLPNLPMNDEQNRRVVVRRLN